MLGLGDFAIFAVYVLCILAALTCVIYGILNWNKGLDTPEDIGSTWNETEKKIEDELEI